MAYNSNGIFSRLYRFRDDRLAGNAISSTKMDQEFDGIATGLSTAMCKNGEQTPTANIPLNGFRITNIGSATAAADAVKTAQVGDNSFNYAADATNTDTYAITLAPAPSAYAAGMGVAIKLTNANTGASTINVNSLGAKNIYFKGAALAGGELAAGKIHYIIYNGTEFDLVSSSHDTDDFATRANVQNSAHTYAAAGGTANAITITLSPAPTAYAAGQVFWFKAASANSAATTINVNSLGAKNIYVDGGALGGGEIAANRMYGVMYDGTQFHLLRSVKDESLSGETGSGDTVFNSGNPDVDATSVFIGYDNFPSHVATDVWLTDGVYIGSGGRAQQTNDPINLTNTVFIGSGRNLLGDEDYLSAGVGSPQYAVFIGNGINYGTELNCTAIGNGVEADSRGGVSVGYLTGGSTDSIFIGRSDGASNANPGIKGIQFGEFATGQGTSASTFGLRDQTTSGTAGALSEYLLVRINGTLYHLPCYLTA